MVPLIDDAPDLIGRLVCNTSVVYFAANFLLNHTHSVEGNRTAVQRRHSPRAWRYGLRPSQTRAQKPVEAHAREVLQERKLGRFDASCVVQPVRSVRPDHSSEIQMLSWLLDAGSPARFTVR